MPSIQGNSYTVSAMVPSMLPLAPAAANPTKSAPAKTEAVPVSSEARVTSARVSEFVAIEQFAKTDETRPDRPPPPPPGSGPPKSGTAGASGASRNQTAPLDEGETALLLLETEETDEEDETVDDAGSQSISILFDEANTYQPSSLY